MELRHGVASSSWRRQRWLAPQPTLTDVRGNKNYAKCNAGRGRCETRATRATEQRETRGRCWGGMVEAERLLVRVKACSPIGLACSISAESERRASERADAARASQQTGSSLAETVASVEKGKGQEQGTTTEIETDEMGIRSPCLSHALLRLACARTLCPIVKKRSAFDCDAN